VDSWSRNSLPFFWNQKVRYNVCKNPVDLVGRDSSVGITTRYELDGPGIESLWGRDFPHQTGPGAYPASCTMGTVGVKRPGRGVDRPPPSNAEVKERVELYLYFPSGPSWPFLGWTLPVDVLSQMNSLHAPIPCFFKTHFNVNLQSSPMSPRCYLPFP
jgi:hypothetical protein